MAESGSLRYSSEMDNEYDFSDSTSFSSEASEEVCLSGPSLGMELLPYHFEPPDPSPADSHVGLHFTSVSTEMEVDRGGNTD